MSLIEMTDLKGHLAVSVGCNSDSEVVMLSGKIQWQVHRFVSVIVEELTRQAGCLLNSILVSHPHRSLERPFLFD